VVVEKEELKLKFANVAKDFDKQSFNGFKPTLDLIIKVINKWSEPKNSH
jgi:hypothetical protein